jgi:hypothetical protein
MADITKETTIYEVVTKLIGPVVPVGETHADDRRFDNLKEMKNLVEMLLQDLHDVAANVGRHEFSMKRAGESAAKFLAEIRAGEV